MTTSSTHPNVERAQEYLSSFAAGDLDSAAKHFRDDIVWRVGGYHPLSGVYEGKEAVLGYLREAGAQTGGSLRVDADTILASDRFLSLFVRVKGQRADASLDADMAQIVRLDEDGRWAEYWALSSNQAAIDEFWA